MVSGDTQLLRPLSELLQPRERSLLCETSRILQTLIADLGISRCGGGVIPPVCPAEGMTRCWFVFLTLTGRAGTFLFSCSLSTILHVTDFGCSVMTMPATQYLILRQTDVEDDLKRFCN